MIEQQTTAQPNDLTDMLAQMRDLVDRVDAATEVQQRHQKCRNADVIRRQFERLEHFADCVSLMRFGDAYSFDHHGGVYMRPQAMGLIEWFYAFTGRKDVSAKVGKDYFSEEPNATVAVTGYIGADRFHVWTTFESPKAVALVESCEAPSVHLLRRLQIVSAR